MVIFFDLRNQYEIFCYLSTIEIYDMITQKSAAASVELIIEFKAVLFPYAGEGPRDCIEFALVLAHCLFQLSGDASGQKFIEEIPLDTNDSESMSDREIHPTLARVRKFIVGAISSDFFLFLKNLIESEIIASFEPYSSKCNQFSLEHFISSQMSRI